MADHRLLELERTAQRERTLEAEARWVEARLRARAIPPAWWVVAARTNEPRARATLGRFVPVVEANPRTGLGELWEALSTPQRVQVLARLARELVPESVCVLKGRTPGVLPQRAEDLVGEAVEALERWAREEGAPDPAELEVWIESAYEGQAGALAWSLRCAKSILHDDPRTHQFVWEQLPRELARRLRDVVGVWSLTRSGAEAPPQWGEVFEVVDADAHAERFAARSADPEVKRQATRIRKRRRAKELSLERVRLAAAFGDPAAWQVERLPGAPPTPPVTLSELDIRVRELILERAPGANTPVRPERVRIVDGVEYVESRRRRRERASWPTWGGALLVQAAASLAERLLPQFEAARPQDERVRDALAAARARAVWPDELIDGQARLEAVRREVGRVRSARKAASGSAEQAVAAAEAALLAARDGHRDPSRALAPFHQAVEAALAADLSVGEAWETLCAGVCAWALAEATEAPARSYRPSETFTTGEVLEHPTFGRGVVRAVRNDRIEVEFPEQRRTLVHKR